MKDAPGEAQADLDDIEEDHAAAPLDRWLGTFMPAGPLEERAITSAEEIKMGIENAPTKQGKESGRGLRKAAAEEERKVEAEKGSDLAKGPDRFEERSRSSDGKSAGEKQR